MRYWTEGGGGAGRSRSAQNIWYRLARGEPERALCLMLIMFGRLRGRTTLICSKTCAVHDHAPPSIVHADSRVTIQDRPAMTYPDTTSVFCDSAIAISGGLQPRTLQSV